MRALLFALSILIVACGCENTRGSGVIETAINTTKEYRTGLKLLEEADILLNRRELDGARKKAEAARVALDKSVKIAPGNNRARLVLGQTLFVLGQVPEIESLNLERQSQQAQQSGEKKKAHALLIEATQKRRAAEPYYNEALQHLQMVHHKLNQDDPSVPYALGRIYTFFERWEDALEMFEEALERTPSQHRIFRDIFRKAIKLCEEEIAISE